MRPDWKRDAFAGTLSAGTISLSDIVSALSFALDLTEDARPGHAVRSCLLGMRIGTELGLPDQQLSSLYYALLLKDIGCSCNANLLCEMVGGDDRRIKRSVKLEDWRYPSISGLKLLWEHAGAGEAILMKSKRVLSLAMRRRRFRNELVRLRCECGVKVGRKIGLPEASVEAISSLDEHWDGRGYPERLRGEAIPILARIINLAQCLDLFSSENGTAAAMRSISARSGSWFDPELVRVARALSQQNRLWEFYGSGMERKVVLGLEPGMIVRADDAQIDRIAEAFADVVDAKSPFTYAHLLGVRDAAMHIARQIGMSGERLNLVYRASLLHDLGKLRVPNSILDKPGKLDFMEWQVVREHPGLSGEILSRIRPFQELARVVGEHHEKLDGSGYPGGLKGDQLSIESRIVAVADVYGALLEDRSYRPGRSRAAALLSMKESVPGKLDAECYEALAASSASGLPFARRDSSHVHRDMYG
ncbi:HAMP domain/GAF domain/HD domain protein [Acidisarcina polymorpha]|uniref:HAMP domain/GAF domain/HD domain protein n=1 Tax=Acidisarcina polymorpha TaxID=2211140 RepID=A0A2Z5FUU8_9BACT|nr:HD-GYP domain-containing protein [Acidisarcina polymorpha]AXC10522.1 HAMP domain/GAF domain/HD domain protein [Acidisarcina polymorpha]